MKNIKKFLAWVAAGVMALPGCAYASAPQTREEVDTIYQFTLDGVLYTLPCDLSVFVENGWNFQDPQYASELIPGLTIQPCWFEKEGEDGTQILLNLLNATGNAMTAGECRVTGIKVDDEIGSSVFETAGGISLGDKREDVVQAYGETGEDGDTWLSYEFGSELADTQQPSGFSFFSEGANTDSLTVEMEEGSTVASIEMNYYKMSEEDATEVSARPDYLNAYSAPDTLSEQMSDFCFELEGSVYTLPAPVSAFLENGWEFSGTSETVAGLNHKFTSMQRADDPDSSLSVEVNNDSENLVALADSYISDITLYKSSAQEIAFSLPGGITMDASVEDLIAAVPQWDDLDGSQLLEDGVYYYVGYSRALRYQIWTEDETKGISITVEEGSIQNIENHRGILRFFLRFFSKDMQIRHGAEGGPLRLFFFRSAAL